MGLFVASILKIRAYAIGSDESINPMPTADVDNAIKDILFFYYKKDSSLVNSFIDVYINLSDYYFNPALRKYVLDFFCFFLVIELPDRVFCTNCRLFS